MPAPPARGLGLPVGHALRAVPVVPSEPSDTSHLTPYLFVATNRYGANSGVFNPCPYVEHMDELPDPLREKAIRAVGARELRHQAGAVLSSIRDGERLVLTRHGRPQAMVLSMRDAVELAVAVRLFEAQKEAQGEWEKGRVAAMSPPADRGPLGPLSVRLASAAAETLETGDVLGWHRNLIRRALLRAAGWRAGGRDAASEVQRRSWLESGRWLIAYSVPVAGVVLVHDFVATGGVERALIGHEIDAERTRIEIDRGTHGRGLSRPSLLGQDGNAQPPESPQDPAG